ncbi:hypothetical protein Tco_1242956 [Tanacetum coccineum]
MEMEHDIENMMLNEYLDNEPEKERRLWRNVRSKNSPTMYERADFNSSHHDKSVTLDFLHYYEDVLIGKYYALPPLIPCFQPPQPHKECGYESADENEDVYIESVEDADDGDIYDIWDITVEDVKRIRQFLTPNVPNVTDDVKQPLILKTIHTTPPDEDYVASATKSILDEPLEEFRNEILNVTMVDGETDFNPTKDIEELERLLITDPHLYFTKIQVIPRQGNGIRGHIDSYSCGKNVVVRGLMHVSGAWLIFGCRETFQGGLVGCYTKNDEVACDCGCCSRKQTWSMA